MGRWAPGAGGRLAEAAMQLYTERGYEQTTVADIADRAGVTERTFFRYFADKREVLFEGSDALRQVILDAIAEAPASDSALDAMGRSMLAAAALLQPGRDFSRQRSALIMANPSLLEREAYKMTTIASASAAALRERGVPELAAAMAAEAGVAVFKVGFERWIADEARNDFAQCIRDALDEVRQLSAAPAAAAAR